MVKRPSYQWYPGDLRRDVAVQACSFEARALWREMLDLMHDGEPYGHLTAGGVPISTEQLARIVGVPAAKVKKWCAELEDRKVFSRTADRIIFSRRMIKDERVRNARAVGGPKSQDHPNVPKPKPGRTAERTDERIPSPGPSPGPSGGPLQFAVASALAKETTTTARAREDFGDVARALDDSPHPQLLERFATLVAASLVTYFGYCRRALGMGAKGLSPPELADVVAQYLANLDTGSELTLNAGRFDAYLKRSIRERREAEQRSTGNGPRPTGRSSPGAEAVERQERVRSTALAVAEAVTAARRSEP